MNKNLKNINLLIEKIEFFEKYQDSVIIIFDDFTKSNEYNTHKFNASGKEIKKISDDIFKNLKKCIENKVIENYDLEVSTDDTLQVISKEKVEQYQYIEKYITTNSKITPQIDKTTNIDKFKFYVTKIVFVDNGIRKEIEVFRRYTKTPKRFKKAFTYRFDGDELKSFDEKLISIDSEIDAFLIDGYFYVINRNSFNSIFKFTDFYEKVIEDKKVKFMNCGLIEDSNMMIEICKNDGRFVKRFSKFLLIANYSKIIENQKNINTVIRDYKLKLETNENNQIILKGKDDMHEILNLLLDHYVVSAFTQEKLLAKAIEEYGV